MIVVWLKVKFDGTKPGPPKSTSLALSVRQETMIIVEIK